MNAIYCCKEVFDLKFNVVYDFKFIENQNYLSVNDRAISLIYDTYNTIYQKIAFR